MIIEGGRRKCPWGLQLIGIVFDWLTGPFGKTILQDAKIHVVRFSMVLSLILVITCNGLAQNCEIDFPGTSVLDYSTECGGGTINSMSLGINQHLGDNDTFTFDSPATINIQGNLYVYAEGDGRIVIPTGVTVNIDGNMEFLGRNGACKPGNPCTLTVVVNGYLQVTGNLENQLMSLVWEGTGTVEVMNRLETLGNGCMSCGTSCPYFPVGSGGCLETGGGCSTDFCNSHYGVTCAADTVDPVISNCPVDLVVSATNCVNTTVNWNPPIAIDNCSLASFTSSHDPGDAFPLGITVVTYTAVDAAGNSSTCSFQVEVVDNTAPVISNCPSNILEVALNCSGAMVSWIPPGFNDNCNVATVTSSHNPGDLFPLGRTVVTYTAFDNEGNSSTCTFQVEVVENTSPVITGCPADMVIIADDCASNPVSWTPPNATDNCNLVVFTSTHTPGETFGLGITMVTYTAIDEYGNTATCSFEITVIDNVIPVITNCPTEIIVPAEISSCEASVNWIPPVASDNCNIVSYLSNYQPGDIFPVGLTTVTYVATDEAGNSASCSFDVTVEDQQAPVINNCPADITIPSFDPGETVATANWTEPLSTDNCAVPSFSSSHGPGTKFGEGQTIVTYRATDASGNETTCSFTVEVLGNHSPTANNISIQTGATEPVQACFIAVDNDGDNILLTDISYNTSLGSVGQIDPEQLCFVYTPALGTNGVNIIIATICDDQIPAGCSMVTAEITVMSQEITIYKAFSPNGDAINDVWPIGNIEQYPENNVTIFDRWGSVVYQASGYNNEDIIWDGRGGGSKESSYSVAPAGTYFYSIQLPELGTKTGFVELIN